MNRVQFLLLKIMEECAEVQQICSKAMQFGLEEIKEGQDKDNQQRLRSEVTDLLATIEIFNIVSQKEISRLPLVEWDDYIKRQLRLEKYKQYSFDLGNVQEAEV